MDDDIPLPKNWRQGVKESLTAQQAPKSPAIEAWCELFSMPCPKTDIDFKRALMMAVIIGRQIESEYNVAAQPNIKAEASRQ